MRSKENTLPPSAVSTPHPLPLTWLGYDPEACVCDGPPSRMTPSCADRSTCLPGSRPGGWTSRLVSMRPLSGEHRRPQLRSCGPARTASRVRASAASAALDLKLPQCRGSPEWFGRPSIAVQQHLLYSTREKQSNSMQFLDKACDTTRLPYA